MPFDKKEAAISARQLLTEKSQASGITIPHIAALIPEALELWSRERIDNPRYRKFFVSRLSASASGGVCDLAPYSNGTSGSIDLADIRRANIYTSAMIPMNWVGTFNQLRDAQLFSAVHPTCFLDGNILYIRNTDGSMSSYSGAIYISPVASYPTTVTAIHPRLQRDFVAFLADLAVGRYREMILAALKTDVQEAQSAEAKKILQETNN